MRAQLRRLLALAEGFDHIEVGVLPTGAPLRRCLGDGTGAPCGPLAVQPGGV